jgi:hypothetical protein
MITQPALSRFDKGTSAYSLKQEKMEEAGLLCPELRLRDLHPPSIRRSLQTAP